MTRATAHRIFEQAKAKAAIVKGGGIHILRHRFAIHLLEAGVDVHTIQVLLGHRSIRSTVRYVHVTRQTLDGTPNPRDLLDLTHRPTLAPQEESSCQPS